MVFEQEKILVPRRSKEERQKNHRAATQKKIQNYIKNESKGDLDLRNTPITHLPDNLTKVEGNLYLMHTPIIQLPNNLKVIGRLYLFDTSIKQLPNNLKVGGDLDLDYTPIRQLSNSLKVEGRLFLLNTPISKKYTKEQIRKMVPGVKGIIFI